MTQVQLETIVILQQDLTEKQYHSVVDDYREIIKDIFKPMKKMKVDLLGKKKLSYEMRSCTEGWYVLFTYNIDSSQTSKISGLERRLRIDDQVLKFMTVKKSEEDMIPLDDIKSEAKSEQPIDAMDVLLGLDDYHATTHVPTVIKEDTSSKDPKGKVIIIQDTAGDDVIKITISEQGMITNMVNAEIIDSDDNMIVIQQIDDYLV